MSNLQELIEDFDRITEIAFDLSMHFDGVKIEDRQKKVSTYYLAKVVPECVSLLRVLPGSRYTHSEEIFDFPSFCSISRSLIEAANLHWYFCIDAVDQSASSFRFFLYDFHDNKSTMQLSNFFGGEEQRLGALQERCDDLKSKLKHNAKFLSLSPGAQNQILKGRKCTDMNQTEISKCRGMDEETFSGIYKILSTNTHSTPSSINAIVHSRMHGKELNEAYAGLILSYVASFVADMVRTIGELWCLEFAKDESEEIINVYSQGLGK